MQDPPRTASRRPRDDILAALPGGDASRAILEHLGLPTEPPSPGAVGLPEPVRDDVWA